ncbi:MAG: phosphoribosylformylglycinamidine cyclo-ligase, partial [Phycisphaerales bacterium]|nr:phosphoribosylformylglycinamidine cyclo-ligase [Phycisphaerales bacterium]
DGVGTKVKIAADMQVYHTVGIDLVAMNVNDLVVQGAEPLFFLDYLGLHRVIPEQTAAMIEGVAKGCEIAGCALIGGECAEMPDVYAEGDFDMAGFAVGVVELRRAINPERCAPGDVVLGLASSGCHSNGYSLVRKVVEHAGLDLGATYPDLDPDRTLAHVLLEPTRIYAEPIVRLQRGYSVKNVISGMAHITGGGLADNLARALSPRVDAVLDAGSWTIPPVFGFLQRHGRIADDEMARVFNMGVGYCLIAKPAFAGAIQRKLERMGETVFPLGKIARGKGRVRFK